MHDFFYIYIYVCVCVLIFIMKNRTAFFVFLLNIPPYSRKQSQNEHLSLFSDKCDEKEACEKTYPMKLEFYNNDGKMKNIIRYIFFHFNKNHAFKFHAHSSKNKLQKFCFAQWSFENSLNQLTN